VFTFVLMFLIHVFSNHYKISNKRNKRDMNGNQNKQNTEKCSFCGTYKKDTNLLIAGMTGNICDSCVEKAYEIVQEEVKRKQNETFDVNQIKLLKPQQIHEFLNEYVIGQEDEKKYL